MAAIAFVNASDVAEEPTVTDILIHAGTSPAVLDP